MYNIKKLLQKATSKKLFDDAKNRQKADGIDVAPYKPSYGKTPIVPENSVTSPSKEYVKPKSKSLNEMIHEYNSGRGSHPLSHEFDRPKNTSGDKDIQNDNYDYSQPSKTIHPYGWIGPEGEFYKVPHYAGHHVVEKALVDKGKMRPWPHDNLYDNHLHVSPEGMNYPDNGLTEAQYNKLLDYNDAVQNGHFDNHTGLGMNRDTTGIGGISKQHIKDFTEKAPKYLKDSYVKANIKMSKSKKVLANFLKLAEDDSDINGSTGAVLDVALKGGPIDMNRAKGLPKSASDKIKWDNSEQPSDVHEVSSIHHPLENEFSPAHRPGDIKKVKPNEIIDSSDFPVGYEDRETPAVQSGKFAPVHVPGYGMVQNTTDGTVLDPELPTAKQTMIHEPFDGEKEMKSRVQPNDFTKWTKEIAPGATVKGLPFSLSHKLIDDFLKTASCENPQHSDKEIRQEKHIEESEEKAGKSKGEAESIGWATVNKQKSANLVQDFISKQAEFGPGPSDKAKDSLNNFKRRKNDEKPPVKMENFVEQGPVDTMINTKNLVKKEGPASTHPDEVGKFTPNRMSPKNPMPLISKNNLITDFLTKQAMEDPCWEGYEMVGKKMKNGKEVPNCVPKKKKKKASLLIKEALNPGSIPFGGGSDGVVGKKPSMPSGRREEDGGYSKNPQMSFDEVMPKKKPSSKFNDYLQNEVNSKGKKDSIPVRKDAPPKSDSFSSKSVIDKAKGAVDNGSNHIKKFVDYLKGLMPKSNPAAPSQAVEGEYQSPNDFAGNYTKPADSTGLPLSADRLREFHDAYANGTMNDYMDKYHGPDWAATKSNKKKNSPMEQPGSKPKSLAPGKEESFNIDSTMPEPKQIDKPYSKMQPVMNNADKALEDYKNIDLDELSRKFDLPKAAMLLRIALEVGTGIHSPSMKSPEMGGIHSKFPVPMTPQDKMNQEQEEPESDFPLAQSPLPKAAITEIQEMVKTALEEESYDYNRVIVALNDMGYTPGNIIKAFG